VNVGGVSIVSDSFFIRRSPPLLGVLLFIVHKTKIGMARRAVSTDQDAASSWRSIQWVVSVTFASELLAASAASLVPQDIPALAPDGLMPGSSASSRRYGGIGSIGGAVLGVPLGLIEIMVVALSSVNPATGMRSPACAHCRLLVKPRGCSARTRGKKYESADKRLLNLGAAAVLLVSLFLADAFLDCSRCRSSSSALSHHPRAGRSTCSTASTGLFSLGHAGLCPRAPKPART
jgi:hypothetical protein